MKIMQNTSDMAVFDAGVDFWRCCGFCRAAAASLRPCFARCIGRSWDGGGLPEPLPSFYLASGNLASGDSFFNDRLTLI